MTKVLPKGLSLDNYFLNCEDVLDFFREKYLKLSDFFREKYLKPHFGNVSWEGEL